MTQDAFPKFGSPTVSPRLIYLPSGLIGTRKSTISIRRRENPSACALCVVLCVIVLCPWCVARRVPPPRLSINLLCFFSVTDAPHGLPSFYREQGALDSCEYIFHPPQDLTISSCPFLKSPTPLPTHTLLPPLHLIFGYDFFSFLSLLPSPPSPPSLFPRRSMNCFYWVTAFTAVSGR